MFSWFKKSEQPSFYDSLLSENLSVSEGELIFNRGICIDGEVNLNVQSSNEKSIVRVSKTGVVNGNVRAYWVAVGGTVNGDINVKNTVEVTGAGKISGNVTCKTFVGNRDSVINGRIFEQKFN